MNNETFFVSHVVLSTCWVNQALGLMSYASLNRKKKKKREIKAGKTGLPAHLSFQNFIDFHSFWIFCLHIFWLGKKNIFVYLILRIKFSWKYVSKVIIGNAVFCNQALAFCYNQKHDSFSGVLRACLMEDEFIMKTYKSPLKNHDKHFLIQFVLIDSFEKTVTDVF